MAGRIKGITVEIGGDTTGLEKALKCFVDKVKGAIVGKKQRTGMDRCAALSITKEIVTLGPLVWTEEKIHARTAQLTEEFKAIWPCG